MPFNSVLFLYLFLPAVILISFYPLGKFRNTLLLLSSLFFYAWGGPKFTLILMGSIIVNYFMGLLIGFGEGTKKAKLFLVIGIILNIAFLAYFKYLNFFADNVNIILKFAGTHLLHVKKIVMPLAVSYYTFHFISYLSDIYLGNAKAQKNFINFSLYISFFPKLIAGPIVRYSQFADQLDNHKMNFEKFALGAERFVLGLGKKVLLANTFAYVANKMFALPLQEHSLYTSWLAVICYTLQIYFDFSGYSDMAIGLAKIFGFDFPENFNFPYISKSIQEFWQRWHITLSAWLREYLFTPLSLNFRNSGAFGIVLSLIITFGLCGLWHGPSWTYLAWGLIHGVFLALENVGFSKILKRLWSPLRHIYVLLIVMIGWVIFRSSSFQYAFGLLSAMIGLGKGINNYAYVSIYLNSEFIICFFIAVIASTRFFPFMGELYFKLTRKTPAVFNNIMSNVFLFIEVIGILLLMFCSSMYIATSTYNPFIYFRF